MPKSFVLTFWLIFAAHCISAQTSEQKIQPRNCELNTVTLNLNHSIAKENNIILIARLGDGETRQELNRRRLYNAKTYLTKIWERDPKTVVVAQGEKVKGYGLIEIYINGMLLDVIAIKRNSDLDVGITCEVEDEIFYPRLEGKLRSQKIKSLSKSKKNNKSLRARRKQ